MQRPESKDEILVLLYKSNVNGLRYLLDNNVISYEEIPDQVDYVIEKYPDCVTSDELVYFLSDMGTTP